MPNYTKYRAYKKQRRAVGTSTWEDVVPLTLSIDGDGTMTPIVLENPSEDCGYVPSTEPIYRWVNINPNVDWICDEYQEQFKVRWKMRGEDWEQTDCDDTMVIAYGDMPVYYPEKQNIVEVEIGQCVSGITNDFLYRASSLSEIVIPDNVRYIENTPIGLLQECSGLTSVTLSNNLEFIPYQMCLGCSSLPSITIPNGVTEIKQNAFFRCYALASITFPNTLTTIGSGACEYCTSLNNVILPSSVTTIGTFAFKDCTSMTSFTSLATTPPSVDEYIFGNTPNINIYVPSGSVNAYKAAEGWSIFANKIVAI